METPVQGCQSGFHVDNSVSEMLLPSRAFSLSRSDVERLPQSIRRKNPLIPSPANGPDDARGQPAGGRCAGVRNEGGSGAADEWFVQIAKGRIADFAEA